MELWKKENLKNIIPSLITLLLGLLWGSAKNELPLFLTRVFQNISPQLVSAIAISGYLLAILIGWIALQLLSENKQLKSQPEFISRFGLNWRKISNRIDPAPHCLCCKTPYPLQESSTLSGHPECEFFRCLHSREKTGHLIDGTPHWAKKDNKPISYKEAYEFVCKEFKIKPSIIK